MVPIWDSDIHASLNSASARYLPPEYNTTHTVVLSERTQGIRREPRRTTFKAYSEAHEARLRRYSITPTPAGADAHRHLASMHAVTAATLADAVASIEQTASAEKHHTISPKQPPRRRRQSSCQCAPSPSSLHRSAPSTSHTSLFRRTCLFSSLGEPIDTHRRSKSPAQLLLPYS